MRIITAVYIGFIIVTLFTVASWAQPDYLRDGTITVTLADGAVYTFSTDEYKVVPRHGKVLTEYQEASGTATKGISHKSEKNTVIFHGGVGRKGLNVGHNGQSYVISEKDHPVLGLTYCRNLDTLGLCAFGFTNSTFGLGVKLDY
jgi:hypothetical protein